MPTLTDVYEPEHLAAARELCESIHDEADAAHPELVRRGTQIPCPACLSETAAENWEYGPWWAPSDPWAAA